MPDNFDREYKVMNMYTDNAKTYIQLSGAALGLSVAFMHQILGVDKDARIKPSPLFLASWIAFLLAIILGALYQYLAAKYMDQFLDDYAPGFWNRLAEQPGWVYGFMLVAFYAGCIAFASGALWKL